MRFKFVGSFYELNRVEIKTLGVTLLMYLEAVAGLRYHNILWVYVEIMEEEKAAL